MNNEIEMKPACNFNERKIECNLTHTLDGLMSTENKIKYRNKGHELIFVSRECKLKKALIMHNSNIMGYIKFDRYRQVSVVTMLNSRGNLTQCQKEMDKFIGSRL